MSRNNIPSGNKNVDRKRRNVLLPEREAALKADKRPEFLPGSFRRRYGGESLAFGGGGMAPPENHAEAGIERVSMCGRSASDLVPEVSLSDFDGETNKELQEHVLFIYSYILVYSLNFV